MKSTTFSKTRLATSLSLILGSSFINPAIAQEPDDVEVIQVKGIRSSIQESMGIKRDSSGVVDAISAEDIGSSPILTLQNLCNVSQVFPLAETMVRVIRLRHVALALTSTW